MYYFLKSTKSTRLYTRKMDAEYAHIRCRRRDKVKFGSMPKQAGDRLLEKRQAILGV